MTVLDLRLSSVFEKEAGKAFLKQVNNLLSQLAYLMNRMSYCHAKN